MADTALKAAIELRKSRTAEHAEFKHLNELAEMLRAPVDDDSGYKLLTDARNTSVYRAALEHAEGKESKLKQEALLEKVSNILAKSAEFAKKPNSPDAVFLYDFFLALNRLFLEKSANRLLQSRIGGLHEFS